MWLFCLGHPKWPPKLQLFKVFLENFVFPYFATLTIGPIFFLMWNTMGFILGSMWILGYNSDCISEFLSSTFKIRHADDLKEHWLLDIWRENVICLNGFSNLFSMKYLEEIVFRPKAQFIERWILSLEVQSYYYEFCQKRKMYEIFIL